MSFRALLFGANLRQRAERVALLPSLLWLVVAKLFAHWPAFDFLLDPLRGLCGGLFQTSGVCRRSRGKVYDADVSLADLSLDYFLYAGLLAIAFAVLTIMAIRASERDLKEQLKKIEKSKSPLIMNVYVFAAALMSLLSLTLVVANIIPSYRLPADVARHLFGWFGLFAWFQFLFLFRVRRYVPPESPAKLEPTPADYWDKRK